MYKFMYDNKEQLGSSIVYDRDMSYDFFASRCGLATVAIEPGHD